MHSRAAIRGKFCVPCIPKVASGGKSAPSRQDLRAMYPKTGSLWQDMRAMHPKSPANSRLGIHRAKILHEGAAFAARTPRIMHGAQILPFLGAPFERFDLFRVGWGGAHGSRTALALYGAVLVFRALSPFVRSGTAVLRVRHTQLRAAPRSHAGCSCCRARLRVRRACYPPRVRWRTFRVVPRGASAFASRRWVCPASPST